MIYRKAQVLKVLSSSGLDLTIGTGLDIPGSPVEGSVTSRISLVDRNPVIQTLLQQLRVASLGGVMERAGADGRGAHPPTQTPPGAFEHL